MGAQSAQLIADWDLKVTAKIIAQAVTQIVGK